MALGSGVMARKFKDGCNPISPTPLLAPNHELWWHAQRQEAVVLKYRGQRRYVRNLNGKIWCKKKIWHQLSTGEGGI